jgi:hypothetical protein
MIKLNLLGSCVTRDAFSSNGKFEINNYFARTSFVSLMSNPIQVNMDDIQLNSNFQKKSVFQDLNKTILNGILEDTSDYLIIDLIDERFNLAKIDDSFVTMSNELRESSLLKKLNHEEINRFDNYIFEFWKKSVDRFFEEIYKRYEPTQIILHKTLWREQYLDKNGEVKNFPEFMINGVRKQNTLLNSYYEYIESFQPKINIIDMTDQSFLSSENHTWGLSPYHFEDRYYVIFNNKLNEIIELPTFEAYSTKMGKVNLIKKYDYKRSYLDFADSSNMEFTNGLNFDENGIPLIKVRDLNLQYYPVIISLYGLECISKYYAENQKNYYKSFISVCDYLIKTQEVNGCWYVPFDYLYYGVREAGTCKAPWVSALSQGWGISCLVRAFYLTEDEKYINYAINALKPFMKEIEEGGVQRKLFNSFVMYQEYPTETPTHILNGFMFSLLGIYDLYKATNYNYVKELFDLGIETLVSTVSMYDQGNISSYDLTHMTIPGNASNIQNGYHLTHVKELSALNSILKNEILSKVLDRWLSYVQANPSCNRLTKNNLTSELNSETNGNSVKKLQKPFEIENIIDALKENTVTLINKDGLKVSIHHNEFLDRLRFAFYVKRNDEVIHKGWYDRKPTFQLPLENMSTEEYEIIIFVRDENDNQFNYSVTVNKI